jgi:1-acyl-sn-glycerol-3-phosphate acyltransferase
VASVASDEGDYGRLFPVARAVLAPMMRFAWRIHTEGLDNLPTDGPAILCPNHTSVLDSFFLPIALLPAARGRRVMFVGKAEYLDDWKTRHLFPAMGMIPIDRSGGEAAQRALDLAAGAIDQGQLFGIYPEGTRSRDGRLHKGHTGPARLAFRTGAPLVPVGIVGSRRIQPPEAKLPRIFEPCMVRIGRPIDPLHYQDRAHDRLALRQITDELMFEIRTLSGQDYVDEYATKGRSSDAEAPIARSSADVLAAAAMSS